MKEYLDFILVLSSAAVMGIMISIVYRLTHSRAVYASRTTVLIVVMAVLSAMLLCLKFTVGSAAVIGVAIIIRFRTPVKDHRDILYVLLSIVSGFACATHMYSALGAAIVALVMVLVVTKSNQKSERVLIVVKGDEESEEDIIESVQSLDGDNLTMLTNNSNSENGTELIYRVHHCDKPFNHAYDMKMDFFKLSGVTEVHIHFQDDDMSI